jgi:hypothetical protein
MQLEVELHALEKEEDKASKAHLVDVRMDDKFIVSYCCVYAIVRLWF